MSVYTLRILPSCPCELAIELHMLHDVPPERDNYLAVDSSKPMDLCSNPHLVSNRPLHISIEHSELGPSAF